MNTRTVMALGASLAALTVGGCGIPLEESARTLPTVEAIAPPTTTIPVDVEPTMPQRETRAVVVFMIRNEGLIGRARVTYEGFTSSELLQFLIDGPVGGNDPTNVRSGLQQRSDLIVDLGVEARLSRLDLSAEFTDLPGVEQVLILGQVTLTMMANLDIDGVAYFQNGVAIAVPDANLEPVTTPTRRSTYAALLAR